MFITFRSRFPFLKSEWSDEEGNSSLWVRTFHESCDRPAFRWIKSRKRLESDIPGTTLSRKSRRGRSRERRRTSFVRESWRITRNREPFHSCFFFFFPLSLSIERLFVPPFLSSPRSVRISSFIETQQVELGWFSKKLAEFIKPAHPVFIARPNLLAPNLDHSVFFFWEKTLLEVVPCCGNVDRFFARRRDSSSLFLEKKTMIITNLIANRWIEWLVRIIDPPLSLVSSFLLCLYARRVLSMALYFFLFPFFLLWVSSMKGISKFTIGDEVSEICLNFLRPCSKGGKGNACTHIHARWWSSRFVDFVRNNDRTLADTASYIQTGAGSGLIVSRGKKRKERRKTNEIGS